MDRRALFIAADLPWPPDGGGRIATLRVLEAYASRFVIDLVVLGDPPGEPDLGPLPDLCSRITVVQHPFTFGRHPLRQIAVAARSSWSREPYRLRKFRSRELARVIAAHRASRGYDVAHYDQFGVAPYHSAAMPSTMTHQNVESDLYRLGAASARDPLRRFWLQRERDKLAAAESRLLVAFDQVFALAPEDADLLQRLGVERVSVIPMPAPVPRDDRRPPRQPQIMSLGSMSWFGVTDGLTWFANEVWPIVRAEIPGVRWCIVGAHANGTIRELARQPGIDLLGHVEDLTPIIATTRVAIVPLMVAGGIRMKLLDFMAWRVPSVATSLAARGLEFADGEGAFRRDTPSEFARTVTDLLTDDGLWIETERRGAAFITSRHSPQRLADAIAAGADAAIRRHRRAATASHA